MRRARPALKAVSQATSKPPFVNIPRIGIPPNVIHFTQTLLQLRANQEAFAVYNKADMDRCMEQKAIQQFKNDSALMREVRAEVSMPTPLIKRDLTNDDNR